jgi:hypothetical protein
VVRLAWVGTEAKIEVAKGLRGRDAHVRDRDDDGA